MIKGTNNWIIHGPPDLINDWSESSSEESYDLYRNMQMVPNVPMPTFMKPLEQKIFSKKSPTTTRLRRSAIVNALGNNRKIIASTPMNHTSANRDSSDSPILQLSPIIATSNTNGESTLKTNKTDKLANDNKRNTRKSKSFDSLSKKEQRKHVSASILATAEHLRKLAGSFRKDNKLQEKGLNNNSSIKNVDSRVKENKTQIEEHPKSSSKEFLSKQLLNNNDNDLVGIEVLHFSSENDSSNRAKTISKVSRLPIRRTVLRERETQTTDSLEKISRKALKSAGKTEETHKEGQSVKRKLIEPIDASLRGPKKTKTVLNEVRHEAESQAEELKRSVLNGLPVVHDAAVQNSNGMAFKNISSQNISEDALMEKFLENFDSKMNTASIISVSSSKENTLKENSVSLRNTLVIGSALSEDMEIPEDNLQNDVADTNETSKTSQIERATNLHSSTEAQRREVPQNNIQKSQIPNGRSSINGKSSMAKSKSTATSSKSKIVDAALDASETSQSSIIQEPTKNSKQTVLRNKSPETAKSNSKDSQTDTKKRGRPKESKNKTSITELSFGPTISSGTRIGSPPSENSNNTDQSIQERTKNSTQTVLRNKSPEKAKSNSSKNSQTDTKKRGRPKGSKNKTSITELSSENSNDTNQKRRGRPKGGKNKKRKSVMLPRYNGRLSGFVRIQPVVQGTNEESQRDLGKRQRQPPKQYIQAHFIDIDLKRRTLKRNPKTSTVGKSKKPHKDITHPTSPGIPTTSTIPDILNYDSDESSNTNKEQPNLRKTRSITDDNENNQKNVSNSKTNPKKGIAEKSKRPCKTSPANFNTSTIAKVLNYDSAEPSTSSKEDPHPVSLNKSDLMQVSVISKESDCIIPKSRNLRNKKSVTVNNKKNQKNVSNSTMNNKEIENNGSFGNNPTSRYDSLSDTSANNKKNCSDSTSPILIRKQKNQSQTSGNILDTAHIESDVDYSVPRIQSSCKTQNENNENTNTRVLENNDFENINTLLPIEASTGSICKPIIVHENISIPSSSAGSQISKDCRKKSVTFIEPPIQVSKRTRTTVPQTQILVNNKKANPNLPVDSRTCLVDKSETVPQLRDDSFSAVPSTEKQNGVETADDFNILYTIVNNEVTALNWVSQPFENNLPTTGMSVHVGLENLKSASGTAACGHIILEPKFQKPWQVLKKHCITYKVEKGKGVVHVHGKKQIVGVGQMFYIPLGAEYTIINLKDEPLILFYHKISSS